MRNSIELKNIRVNNLKNISLDIPHNKFVVVTGVSGSGKSSLAFDTLYAEGQRRYVESLSAYARQFLGRMSKPEFDSIKGLPPAIAVEQKVNTRNARSTVGTSTEIYDYLRMLFARIGHTFSPVSGNEVKKHSLDDVFACINSFSKGTKFLVLSKIKISKDNNPLRQLQIYLRQGFSRIYHNGELEKIEDIVDSYSLINSFSDYYIVIDRLAVDDNSDTVSRIYDSLETAFFEGEGTCRIVFFPSNLAYDFSDRYECDGIVFEEPTIEFSYKNDALHDPLLNAYHAVALDLADKTEIQHIKLLAFRINYILKEFFKTRNIKLVDFKMEFGRLPDGTIVLADEISPDTCRFWDYDTNQKLDKDRFRRDMGGVEDAYEEMYRRVFG